ncbi:MAG: hypothetical protein HN580_15025, partial [Deltaproteobacteria bacterium]|nr:hypothetical protein [Deltaproteobacteria bacterium]
ANDIKHLLDDEQAVPFSRFRKWFLEVKNRDDLTPLDMVEKFYNFPDDLKGLGNETVNPRGKKDRSMPIPDRPVENPVEHGDQMSIFDLLDTQEEK